MPRINRTYDATPPVPTNALYGTPEVAEMMEDNLHTMPVINVLTDMIVNGEARSLPAPEYTNRRNRRPESQWINKYIPITDNGNVFLKYSEELRDKEMDCRLISAYDGKSISLPGDSALNLRNALNTILGEKNV